MFRTILITTAALLALDTAGAVRVLDQVERAIELALNDLTLPAVGGSTISFSECASCGISTHRLLDSTTYEINDQPLPLADFLRVTSDIRSSGNKVAVATVYLDIDTGRVTRVEVRE